MAVIYVPKDTRWADAAQGLGSLLATYVQAQQQNKITNGVAQILNDPTTSNNPNAQLAAVTKAYGAPGLQVWGQLLSNQAKVAQIGLAGSETGKNIATTQQIEGMTPEQIAELRANTAATGARANLTSAMIPQEQARTQSILAGVPGVAAQSTQAQQEASGGLGTSKASIASAAAAAAPNKETAETGALQSESDIKAAQAASIQAQTKALQGLLSPADPKAQDGPTGADLALDKAGITDPAAREAAKNALVTEGVTGWTRALEQAAKVQQQNAKQDVLPEDVRKNLDTGSKMTTYLEPFLQPSSDASATGFAAGFSGWAAKKGIGSQNPEILQRMTAGEQAMGAYAEQGSGIAGSWRAKLGYDLTPQLSHTAVANVISTQQIANAQVQQLKQMRQQVENVPKYKDSLPAIDDQIKQYEEIQNKANSLWWGYDGQDGKGNGTGKIHFYYQGGEVDPKTLQWLAPAQSSYRVNPGYSTKLKQQVSDEYIQRVARATGLTPQAASVYLGVKQQ